MPDPMTELSAEEQALLDADRGNTEPVVPTGPPEPRTSPSPTRTSEQTQNVSRETPEPAQTPAVQPEAGPDGGDAPPQTVPYSALAEERSRRKEAEKQAREFREQMQRLSGRLDVLAPADQKPAAKPTVAEQPIEVLQELAQWKQEREQQDQAAQQWGQFNQAMANATREFEATNPDFGEAIKHLEAARVRELRAIGLPDAQIQNVIQQEAVQISSLAFQQGANPADRFYKLAQERGYQKAAEGPGNLANPAQQTLPRGSNGQFQAAEKLATVARGQQAAGRSLSGAGGGSGGEMTAESLASMSETDFQEWATDPKNERAWRRMMGA